MFASAASLFAPAHAAVVTLNNGDQVSGKVLTLKDGTLTFKSDVFGEISIPWTQVRRLDSDDGLRMRLADGTDIQGRLSLEQDSAVVDAETQHAAVSLERQEIVALNPALRGGDVKYGGQIDFGGAANRGNSNDTQVNFIGSFNARAVGYRYNLGLELNEARASGATTASNQRLHGQYDRFLSAKDYLFFSASAERDEPADLDLRATLGAGYGRQFLDGPVTRLAGQVGVTTVREHYGASPDQSFPGLGLGLKYDRSFLGGKLVYFQHHDLDVSLQDAEDALLRTRLGLRVPIGQSLSVSTQLNLDYDNTPAPGNEKLDSGLIFSVGYAF